MKQSVAVIGSVYDEDVDNVFLKVKSLVDPKTHKIWKATIRTDKPIAKKLISTLRNTKVIVCFSRTHTRLEEIQIYNPIFSNCKDCIVVFTEGREIRPHERSWRYSHYAKPRGRVALFFAHGDIDLEQLQSFGEFTQEDLHELKRFLTSSTPLQDFHNKQLESVESLPMMTIEKNSSGTNWIFGGLSLVTFCGLIYYAFRFLKQPTNYPIMTLRNS